MRILEGVLGGHEKTHTIKEYAIDGAHSLMELTVPEKYRVRALIFKGKEKIFDLTDALHQVESEYEFMQVPLKEMCGIDMDKKRICYNQAAVGKEGGRFELMTHLAHLALKTMTDQSRKLASSALSDSKEGSPAEVMQKILMDPYFEDKSLLKEERAQNVISAAEIFSWEYGVSTARAMCVIARLRQDCDIDLEPTLHGGLSKEILDQYLEDTARHIEPEEQKKIPEYGSMVKWGCQWLSEKSDEWTSDGHDSIVRLLISKHARECFVRELVRLLYNPN